MESITRMNTNLTTLEGQLSVPANARFVLVASRFNHFIVDHLVSGAVDAILRHGGQASQITKILVPGAWELPLAVEEVAHGGKADAIIVLGAVIRGSTPHFDYVAGEATKGTAQTMMKARVPVAFGLLTTDNIEQAIERAGTKAGNKGWDAAMAAIEMVSLLRTMRAGQ